MAFQDGGSSSKGSRRRSYEAHINLVPYIDMMTTIIAFLMLSTVWTQIQSLEVINAEEALMDEALMLEKKLVPPVSIYVKLREISVHFQNQKAGSFSIISEAQSESALSEILKSLSFGKEKPHQVKLFVKDEISYGFIARVVDTSHGLGFQTVAIRSFEEHNSSTLAHR